jgi:hypothetical protein
MVNNVKFKKGSFRQLVSHSNLRQAWLGETSRALHVVVDGKAGKMTFAPVLVGKLTAQLSFLTSELQQRNNSFEAGCLLRKGFLFSRRESCSFHVILHIGARLRNGCFSI